VTNKGGANIRLGTGATSYHAILFSGVSANQAQTCADWYDVSKTWDLLVQSGYDPKNIKVMFGNGKRADDGSPALLGEDQKAAPSVSQKNQANPGQCPYDKELDKAGKPTTIKYEEASYAKLKEAIEGLQKAAAASPTEQYFIWSGAHNTTSANDLISLAPPPERPNRTPTGYVSTVPAVVPVSMTTEQVSWTGGYGGAQLSGSFGMLETSEFIAETDVRSNHFEDNGSGFGAGINAGYNWRPAGGNVVVGPFASFDYLNQVINHSFLPGGMFLGTSPRPRRTSTSMVSRPPRSSTRISMSTSPRRRRATSPRRASRSAPARNFVHRRGSCWGIRSHCSRSTSTPGGTRRISIDRHRRRPSTTPSGGRAIRSSSG
jgi:hypothetical protein